MPAISQVKYLCIIGLLAVIGILACKPTEVAQTNAALTYEDYLAQRHRLMASDSALYFDHEVQLNEKESKLNEKLLALQRSMIADYKANHFFPPARNFYQSKAHIEGTRLFNILRKMPKGGILHLHLSAMGDANWLIDRAINTPEMHVYWQEDNADFIKGELYAYPGDAAPGGFFPAADLNDRVTNFRDSLRSFITFDENIDRDSVDIWSEFEHIFQRIDGFVMYKPVWVDHLVHGLQILTEDNIQHAELRVPFFNTLYELDKPVNITAMAEYVETLVEAKQRIEKIDPDFTLNIIHANLRFFDEETIWQDIQFTHQNRVKYPEWVRGYDLVAEEDAGNPTLYHANNFLKLDSLERTTGTSLPLYLHDGESDWASVDNLYDAVLLGTRRIGHGFNLFRFPKLLDLVREKNICMEINPLSNQILGYVRDLRIHPASTYLRRGIDCTISSDDPLIFDYQGLSYDYWSIFLAWELDLAALKKLSKNSITHSAMTEDEKIKALGVWQRRWDAWVIDN